MNHFQIVLAVFICGLPMIAAAQKVSDQPETVVTASGVAQTVDATLADVSIIDRAKIEASGASDIYQLLRLETGVDIVRSGGAGTQTNVFLRGSNSNHVLVLVDGVRVASLNTGAFAWEQLSLDVVQRIEIVRGPRAAVWGSDAIGGVIQIFTRRLEGGTLATRIGSHGDSAASGGIGHWQHGQGFSIEAGIRHVRGFSAQNPEGFSYDPDNDGERNRNVSARGSVGVGTQKLSASGMFSDSTVEFDQGVSHNIEQATGARLEGQLTAHWSHALMLGYAREDLSTAAFAARFRSHRNSLGWRNAFTLGAGQQLVAGIDLVHETGASINTGSGQTEYSGNRDNHALYTGWYAERGRVNWELAARHDDNSEFGTANTGSAALGVRLSPWVRLSGSWGQGFRSPNLNEQFSPGYGGYYAGNPALQPERSHTSELSVNMNPLDTLDMRLSHYRTDINQLISFTQGEKFQAENVARARIDGTELSANWRASAWQLMVNTTWQNPRDLTTGTDLLRRPRRKANLVLGHDFSTAFDAGLEWVAVGRRPEIGGELPGYTLLNARANWRFSPHMALHLRGENLFDRHYSELRGFNTAGRSCWLELAWRQN